MSKFKRLQGRALRFGVRTFLATLTFACIWLGWAVNHVAKQRDAVRWVRSLGGFVYYDFEWNNEAGESMPDATPPGPYWLRSIVGIDFLATPSAVIMTTSIQSLGVTMYFNGDVSDISRLGDMRTLKYLSIAGTQVSDLSPIAELTHLTVLDISDTKVADVSALENLASLRFLYLGPAVTEESQAKLRKKLPNCKIVGSAPSLAAR